MNHGGVVHDRWVIATAAETAKPINSMRVIKAIRHRLAHFISAMRTIETSCSRSASGFPAWKSSGAVRGEMRMMDPSTQKIGKTIK